MIPPLAVVQARMGSMRLPGKMLLPLGGKPLIAWAWGAAVEAFGADHVIVATPNTPAQEPLWAALKDLGATCASVDVPEADVLARFHVVAHTHRWRPESVIVRITPDDPFKDVAMLRRVAEGERLPVELGGEAFTLADLDAAHAREYEAGRREHISHALFQYPPPPAPPGIWTIDTEEDYRAAKFRVAGESKAEKKPKKPV